jgi:site-specific recombinase XerD
MNTLGGALAEYVATARALGTKLRWPASILRRFIEFLECEGAEFITTELALRWATKPTGVQTATWARRLGIVRGFARWLHATDSRTEVPAQGLLPARHRRKPPHIYSDQEVVHLMAAATHLSSPRGLRSKTYATLIGLLAATGLRPGEALALDEPDVDLHNAILAVRETKFGKSRFVPVEESVATALAHYAGRRNAVCSGRKTRAFFVTERGGRLVACAARRTFAKLSRAIGLRAPLEGRRIGRGPRLQDLRHTFATRRLLEWYRAGLDVGRLMPGLATYLGHGSVHDTYWYIQAVPELLELATRHSATRSAGGGR